jgi:hypothetical protein
MPPRYKRPVSPAERARREQATADKLTALHERLAEQVAALRSGEDWRRWLDVARRFHGYSFNNTLLIAAQRPDATAVAGYEAWKALGSPRASAGCRSSPRWCAEAGPGTTPGRRPQSRAGRTPTPRSGPGRRLPAPRAAPRRMETAGAAAR